MATRVGEVERWQRKLAGDGAKADLVGVGAALGASARCSRTWEKRAVVVNGTEAISGICAAIEQNGRIPRESQVGKWQTDVGNDPTLQDVDGLEVELGARTAPRDGRERDAGTVGRYPRQGRRRFGERDGVEGLE